MRRKILQVMFVAFVCVGAHAQVNSGSNGSDGAFNPATSTVINMASHPNGIYQYTSVTISNGVTVTFIPNANNSPVTWLVQSNVVINGTVDVSGQGINSTVGLGIGGIGGPGGGAGGNGGSNPSSGQGPGGGSFSVFGGGGSFGTQGRGTSGQVYGNSFLLPLLGGSGGSADVGDSHVGSMGGDGGGGAILIAASGFINLNGIINASGGATPTYNGFGGGGGSGGGVRLVTLNFTGTGQISASGGLGGSLDDADDFGENGGSGRIRIDAFQNDFGGQINGVFTQGYQPIIIPVAGQGVQLSIASVAGAAVSATPNGQLVTPDAIISGQQANPILIVVNCANLPLNTLITVTVKPASGASVSAVGYNSTGTLASSMATVSLTMPRGGGIIYATAATSN
jgi:hypothetical protein